MANLQLENFCFGVIGTDGITAAQGEDTTFIVVPSSTSGVLPATGEFILVVYASTCVTPHDCLEREGIRIKSRAGNVLTIKARNAIGGGSQQAWVGADKYVLSFPAEKVEEIETEMANLTVDGGVW